MRVDIRVLTAALLILAARTTLAQVPGERCGYMVQIPRPPTPELPDQDFTGLSWSERPFLPAEKREDVCMDMFYLDPHTNVQVIYMEEEIIGDVVIAKLNYKGKETPTVLVPFNIGTFSMLGPIIRRIPEDGGDWHLVITNKQDFETPGMQSYSFRIRIEDETLIAVVSLVIVNIDDNRPIIELIGPCTIAEKGETGVSECKYRVNDIDGEISTRFMTFEIESDRGDEEVFEFIRENVPNQWFWLNMVMVVKKPLDFAVSPLHIFRVTALDSLPNTHTVSMMVEVENVESRSPVWVEIFAMEQFDEKTPQSFRVRAIDGDTGIRRRIHYRLETRVKEDEELFRIETIEGDEGGALLHVEPIDRDELEREVFHLTLIAYKYGENDEEGSPSFVTPVEIVIIVNDVNDQKPLPFHPEYTIDIEEETAMTLDIEDFGFHDRDLGPRAEYTVELESVYPIGAHKAFYIAPGRGYQRQSFIIGTADHHMLDYEVIDFQKIQLRAVATDMDNNTLVGVATININLINWNDELPMFEHTAQTVSFEETVGKGYHVGRALAKDLDIGDRVEHTLMGNANDYLTIDKDTGDIFVTVDDAFNYHRQNELFIQIRADDTLGAPYHTNTSQLVIQLQDINNTPPTLRLPRGSPLVEENVPQGYLISDELRATDPDTTADLNFEIDWDSSYATKQGRETPTQEFHNCVTIETVYPTQSRGTAIGRVVVREIRENVTIDYEEFEVLYLTIRVRDRNTVIGDDYDESTFTITIIDMNDNPPVWGEGQLTQQFRVREMSASGAVIGSVFATDIDGPLYNQVRYTISPRKDTPDDLVAIDFVTGQITVKKNQAIDADVPPRHYLYYTVVASDKCSLQDVTLCPPDEHYHDTDGEITIQIIDTNNKVPRPELDKFETVLWIYEGSPDGLEFEQIVASDLDRDLPYNNVSYQINYAVNSRLRDFFAVDLVTGVLSVHYTGPDVLDRDGDEPQHRIFFNIIDNFLGEGDGNRNQIDGLEVLVILLDVNDNAPEMPSPNSLSWTVSENEPEGVRLQPHIFAFDRDEPGTPNSLVAYGILGLTPERDIELPELFKIITIETEFGIEQTGELETVQHLKGYWGTYEIHIQAYDHGDPRLKSDEKYQLVVRPYNFREPEFVFPKTGSIIRLSRERAMVNSILVTAGAEGAALQHITATDEDGLHAGTVSFSIVGEDNAVDYFDMWSDGGNFGTLILKRALPEGPQEFKLTIRATDAGTEPGPKSSDTTVTVVFVTQGEPVFSPNTQEITFLESGPGMAERYPLGPAIDPKNTLCDEDFDCYDIFYSIIGDNANGHFALDGAWIYLVKELNRSVAETHTLQVAASNTPGVSTALPESILTVTITVRELNPRPHFERKLYTAGISSTDDINRELRTLQATHSEGLPITYTIDQESMVVDPSLQAVQDAPFNLHPESGVLTLIIQPTASMHGMFEFKVVATDTNGEYDSADVKVYLISSRNRVYFIFNNREEDVRQHSDFIALTFSAAYAMTCNIDQTLPATDANGNAIETRTEVRAHFIRDDLPVPVEEIEELRRDVELLGTIAEILSMEHLILAGLQTGGPSLLPGGDDALAVYILAGIAGLLAVLCVVLLVIFIIRNRELNRRIAALSITKYSSVDSGLNRIGLAAPGTNKHAVEGSNPIWNETIKAPDFDAISELSNDSDLIGIEDLPQFRSDYFPPEFDESMKSNDSENPAVQSARNPIASHQNSFNTTPFSPEFANTQLRK